MDSPPNPLNDSWSFSHGGSTVFKDVPAYVMAAGIPASANGMNFEGMRRRGWDSEKIQVFKNAYQTIYKKNHTLSEAIQILENDITETVVTFSQNIFPGMSA